MSDKLWFGCPKCFLAFYSRSEYDRHYETDHPGARKDAVMIKSNG